MDISSVDRPRMLDVFAGLLLLGALLVVLIGDRLLTPVGADVVFIVDQRPTMKDLRTEVRNRCLETARTLNAQEKNNRFAVIPFGGQRNHLATIDLTQDVDAFRDRLLSSPVDAPPADTTIVSAIQRALTWKYREGLPVIFYIISPVPCENAEDVRDVADQLNQRGIVTFIQANETSQAACLPFQEAGGHFFSLDGRDLTDPDLLPKSSASRAANLVARLSTQAGDRFAVNGLYSARTSANRNDIVTRGGGSVGSEQAVAAGLDWLARHQADDGHWADHKKCESKNRCPSSRFKRGATNAETGLAILAFQAGGYYDFNGSTSKRPEAQRYAKVVKRGLDFLVEHQRDDGCWFGPKATWYEHGIATFAMAEACAVAYANHREPDSRYLKAAGKAITFMEDHQYTQGGWRYDLDSKGPGDTSVTGWQALAMKSALEAEIPISKETLRKTKDFFAHSSNIKSGETYYMPNAHRVTLLTTAVGLITQHFIAKTPDSTFAQKAAELLASKANQGVGHSSDFYTLYNANLAMFLAGGDRWKVWNHTVRDEIIQRQIKTGCARGSWEDTYGRTLGTAWAVLTLEVYYRYVPSRDHSSHETHVAKSSQNSPSISNH